MSHKDLELRLQTLEEESRRTRKKAEEAKTEAILCRQVMKSIMDQNAQYREKLIEFGYLI